MWRVWYLKHRVREILENKDGVGVVEIFTRNSSANVFQ